MNIIIFIIPIAITIIWLSVALLDYLQFCALWQTKEYRLDRFSDFLATKQGKDFLKSYLFAGRLIIFFLYLSLAISKIEAPLFLTIGIIIFETLRIGRKVVLRKIILPQKTTKVILIAFLAMAIEIGVMYMQGNVFSTMEIFGLRFFVLSLAVFLLWFPTKAIKRAYIFLATKKLRKYPELKVIGITGSYGKTTVKNFLLQILQTKFAVTATPKNINTEIGIARFILQADFSKTDIFVVEMGAYKKGEIKIICDMVKPEVGILTAINEQHLSLFGSLENIQKTKYELLRSLPENGLAITNSDNKYCREFLGELKCAVKTFGKEKEYSPTLLLSDVETSEDMSIKFDIEIDSEKTQFLSRVLGKHNAFNIAPCIMVAQYFGIDMLRIKEQTENLELPEGTLRIFHYGQSIIIDDSYNSNPDGFLAALETLGAYQDKYKKIIITRGMIELGNQSVILHKKVGEKISKIADELVIISSANEDDLAGGIDKSKINIIKKYDSQDLLEYVRTLQKNSTIVLVENTIPQIVLDEITKK